MDISFLSATFTDHFTAELKSTFTIDSFHQFHCIVATATAQQLTAVSAHRSGVTLAAPRAQRARLLIRLTVTGRLFRIHQILFAWRLDCVAFGYEALVVIAGDHFDGAVELVLQPIAHVSKQG